MIRHQDQERPSAGRAATRVLLSLAGALPFVFASCANNEGKRVAVDSVQAPPGTIRAVFFEYVAHCKRNSSAASSGEPESSCSIEMTGVSLLEPDRDGKVAIHRQLEVDHDAREHGDAWDEQGVELIAYGPKGSAAFSTRLWHDFAVWSPGKGPARCTGDPRADAASLSAAERRSFALEPMAASIETLFEVPPKLRLDLRPYVLDMANLLESLLVESDLSNESRERVTQHLASLDEAMSSWGVDWLARRSS